MKRKTVMRRILERLKYRYALEHRRGHGAKAATTKKKLEVTQQLMRP